MVGDLTDAQWEAIRPFITTSSPCRPIHPGESRRPTIGRANEPADDGQEE